MKTYKILEIANELGTNKEQIRSVINKLGIDAENETTRSNNHIAKVYNLKAKNI